MKKMIRICAGLLVLVFCTACSRDDAGSPGADAAAAGTQADAAVVAAGHVEGRVTNPECEP